MEAKKSKRGMINIIDIIIVVLLIVGIVFLAMQYNKVKNPTTAAYSDKGEAVDVYFDVQLSAVREEVYPLLEEGAQIRFDVKTNEYGEIYKISEPKLAEVTYSNAIEGKYEKATFPDKYDITITIKAEGYENDDKITAGNFKVTVGSSLYLKTADFAGSGYVYDVRTEKRGSAE